MYLLDQMIDMGLEKGQTWPSRAHRAVACNLAIGNPMVTVLDDLTAIVQKVIKIPNDKIKSLPWSDLPAVGHLQKQQPGPWSRELVKAIAMDIGKAVVHHIETMYPDAADAVAKSSFKLSVRNAVYNEIMAAIEVNDAGQITARLKERKQHRRRIKAAYTKIRATPT